MQHESSSVLATATNTLHNASCITKFVQKLAFSYGIAIVCSAWRQPNISRPRRRRGRAAGGGRSVVVTVAAATRDSHRNAITRDNDGQTSVAASTRATCAVALSVAAAGRPCAMPPLGLFPVLEPAPA